MAFWLRGSVSLLAGLLRRQTTGLLDAIQLQPGRRELGDFLTALRSDLHFKNLGPNKTANGTFIHGEDLTTHPVPSVVVVGVGYADYDLHLGLPPEAGPVGRSKPSTGIEICLLQLTATAKQLDPVNGIHRSGRP